MIEIKVLEPTIENAYLTEELRLKSYGISPKEEDYDKYYIENICNGSIMVFAYYKEKHPIAACYISDSFNSIYIDYLFVLPEYQNKGLQIGRKLLQFIFDNKHIVEEYYHKEFTQSKLYAANEKAKSIYKEFGYKEEQSELLVKKIK